MPRKGSRLFRKEGTEMDYYTQGNITVTVPSRDIRAFARESLAGKWKIAAVGTLIYMTITTIPQLILSTVLGSPAAANLYFYLVSGAFNLGYAVFILNIFRNKNVDYSQIFCGFERILKTVGLYLYTSLFIALWTMLFIVPGIIAAIRYSQVYYIFADNPDMPITEIVNESKRMMRTNKAKYFCLGFSFIGWIFLAAVPSSIYESFTSVAATASIIAAGNAGFDVASIIAAAQNSIESMSFFTQMVTFVLEAGYFWVTPYMECANAALYEMMKGNLRPGIIDTTATVINNAGVITGSVGAAGTGSVAGEMQTVNNADDGGRAEDAETGSTDVQKADKGDTDAENQ